MESRVGRLSLVGERPRTETHEVVSRVTRHRGGITPNDCGYSTGVNRRASLKG